MKLKERIEQRTAVAKKMHDIVQTAKDDKDRGLTPEERSDFDAATKALADLDQRIADDKAVELAARSGAIHDNDADDRYDHETSRRNYEPAGDDPNAPPKPYEKMRALRAWATSAATERDLVVMKRMGLNPMQKQAKFTIHRGTTPGGTALRAPRTIEEAEKQSEMRQAELNRVSEMRPEHRAAYEAEQRAMGVSVATGGAELVPDEMMREIDIAMLQIDPMREHSTVISTSTGADMPWPTANDTSNEGEIVGENAAVAAATDIPTDVVTFSAFQYSSKPVKIPHQLMTDSLTGMAALVGRLCGERIARHQNRHFTVGTGSGQPNGIVTAAADSAITTAANTALVWDSEILPLKHSVNRAYRNGAKFMTSDAGALMLKQMKDSQNRPLWLPALAPGASFLIDGDEVVVNDMMPTGAAAKTMVYGQLAKYIIREVNEFVLYRMDELFILNLQVGFLGTARADGDLVDAGTNPVKYLTSAA